LLHPLDGTIIMNLFVCTIAALAATTLAAKDLPNRESVSLWDVQENQQEMGHKSDAVAASLDMMESFAEAVGPAAKIALTSVERIDNAAVSVAAAKTEIVAGLKVMAATKANTVTYKQANDALTKSSENINAAFAEGSKALKDYRKKVTDNFEAATNNGKKIGAATRKLINEMTAAVKKAVTDAASKGNYEGTHAHIKQVTGIDYNEPSQYWDGKAVVSNSERGNVKGRIFYKVKFNLKQAGYWTANSDELFLACTALSTYLRQQDGVERDLRPPCNHYNHPRVGGMGQCIQIDHSYFSHCGGGGYWRESIACGGVSESWIRNTVGYETLEHNYDRHLVHRQSSNSHSWADSFKQSGYQYTLCTGGNMNFRTKPTL